MCLLAVAPLIGRYCGTKIPPEIQSSSGLLSLSFHTDMAVAKDGFSARYNMTHKEVSDCECEITFSECVYVQKCPLCRFVYRFLSPSPFSSFQEFLHRHLWWHSSFLLHLSLLLPSRSFQLAYFNAISISQLSLTLLSLFCFLLREHDFSEVDYFLLEYKLTSPQFTSAHLLDCFLSPSALSLSGFTFSSLSSSSIICYLDLLSAPLK